MGTIQMPTRIQSACPSSRNVYQLRTTSRTSSRVLFMLVVNHTMVLLLMDHSMTFGQQDKSVAFLDSRHVRSCCFVSNDTLLTASSKGELCLWSLRSAAPMRRYLLSEKPVYGLSVVDGGKRAVAVHAYNEIVWFDLVKGQLLHSIKLPSDISRLITSPDSKQVVAACADGAVRIHQLENGKERACLRPAFSDRPTPLSVTTVIEG